MKYGLCKFNPYEGLLVMNTSWRKPPSTGSEVSIPNKGLASLKQKRASYKAISVI